MELLARYETLSAGLTLFAAVAGLFWKGDDAISPAAREWLSTRFQNISTKPTAASWPSIFENLFDSLFGKKHFTLKCFFRSCIASTIALIIVFFLFHRDIVNYYDVQMEQLRAFLESVGIMEIPFHRLWFGILTVAIFIPLNLLIDYLSLLQTRRAIAWLNGEYSSLLKWNGIITHYILMFDFVRKRIRHRIYFKFGESFREKVSILILDFVFTFLIFFGLNSFFSIPIGMYFSLEVVPRIPDAVEKKNVEAALALADAVFLAPGILEYFGLLFLTTCITSIWLWLYLAGYFCIKGITRINFLLRFVVWVLPIQSHPLRSLGIFSGGIATLLYWVSVV